MCLRRIMVVSIALAAVPGPCAAGYLETFEATAIGQLPEGWQLSGNNQAAVAAGSPDGADKVLRLAGSAGGCWTTLAHYPWQVPSTGTTTIRLSVMPTSEGSAGCHGSSNMAIRFYQVPDWTEGPTLDLVSFDTDGNAKTATGSAPYSRDEWNDVEIQITPGSPMRVVAAVNGVSLTEDSSSDATADQLAYFTVLPYDFVGYVDDIEIVHESAAPAPSPASAPPADSGGQQVAPQARFGFGVGAAGGLEVAFQDQSTDDGMIVSWYWTFGDGQTSTLASPMHAFPSEGSYRVCLRVVDDEGVHGVHCEDLNLLATGSKLDGAAGPAATGGDTALAPPDPTRIVPRNSQVRAAVGASETFGVACPERGDDVRLVITIGAGASPLRLHVAPEDVDGALMYTTSFESEREYEVGLACEDSLHGLSAQVAWMVQAFRSQPPGWASWIFGVAGLVGLAFGVGTAVGRNRSP